MRLILAGRLKSRSLKLVNRRISQWKRVYDSRIWSRGKRKMRKADHLKRVKNGEVMLEKRKIKKRKIKKRKIKKRKIKKRRLKKRRLSLKNSLY
jgi:hypothetical protein